MRASWAVVALSIANASSAAPAIGDAGEASPPLYGSDAVVRARAGTDRVPGAAREAWAAFAARHPGPWRVEWDARAGTPRQIWGASIPLVAEYAAGEEVQAAVIALLRGELAALSRVSVDRLRPAVFARHRGAWFVRFLRVTQDGTPVAGAYVEARVVRGRLVLLRLETHPAADSGVHARRVTKTEATRLAEDALRPFRDVERSEAAAILAPIASGAGWDYRAAWDVVTRSRSGEAWRTRVDAVYGELLSRESLTPSLSGRVTALVEPRTVGDTLAEAPLPHVLVSTTGAGEAVTTTDGTWTFTDPAPLGVSLALSGPFVRVQHVTAPEAAVQYEALDGDSDHVWTAPGDATQAELAAFRHASTARAWALGVAPENPWLQEQVDVRVGNGGQCNALWDGSIVLYGEGGTCNDTARVADVVYHEYGHGFHQHVRVSGVLDPTVGEGIGDYVSATINDSPRIGLGLYKGVGDGALRDVSEDLLYSELTGEVHTDGLIFAGAMWDVRAAFVDDLGPIAGRAASDALFTGIVAAGPTLDQTFVEALLADDDDADLANGTPNRCLLEAEFGRHGLTGASGLFSLEHAEVQGAVEEDLPIAILAQRPAAAALCASNEIASVALHWQVDGGTVETLEMTLAGEVFTGDIPPVEAGAVVRYWFESALESGDTVLTPPRAPSNAFAFHVGPLEVVWSDDFETVAGWTSGGAGDDWQIGAPQGLGGDPAAAFSGTNVLGNRLDGDGLYAADADTFIESPPIDCRKCRGARLQFRRHGRVQQAISDRVTVGIGTLPVWQNEQGVVVDELSVEDPMWSFQEYDVSELADGGANIRIRFSLQSDSVVQSGGWTVDDVALVMPPRRSGRSHGEGCGCSLGTRDASALPSLLLLALALTAAGLRRR